jgi:hypothetical protein
VFDRLGDAWEAAIAAVLAAAGTPTDDPTVFRVRFFSLFLHQGGGLMYRRRHFCRVSFVNLLFALCMDAIAFRLFRMSQQTNQALLFVTPTAMS